MSRNPEQVVDAVAEHFGVDVIDILGDSREAQIAGARQWAMDICRRVLGWSSSRVGEYFGRDRSTILHASRVVGAQVANGRASEMAELIEEIQGHNGNPPVDRARPGSPVLKKAKERDEISVVLRDGGVVSLRLQRVMITQLEESERRLVLDLIDRLHNYATAE